jgi:hypothetical protein
VEIRDATSKDANAVCDLLRGSISQLCVADHGNALLGALEIRAAERGNTRCTLTSTETAHRFYLSGGYIDDGAPVGKFGTRSGYQMSKRLAVPGS